MSWGCCWRWFLPTKMRTTKSGIAPWHLRIFSCPWWWIGYPLIRAPPKIGIFHCFTSLLRRMRTAGPMSWWKVDPKRIQKDPLLWILKPGFVSPFWPLMWQGPDASIWEYLAQRSGLCYVFSFVRIGALNQGAFLFLEVEADFTNTLKGRPFLRAEAALGAIPRLRRNQPPLTLTIWNTHWTLMPCIPALLQGTGVAFAPKPVGVAFAPKPSGSKLF